MIRTLVDLIQPDDILVSHGLIYDLGEVLGVDYPKLTAKPHFGGTKESLEKLLATPRLCTCIWKKHARMEQLAEQYGVRIQGAHDARGDSKALAECLSKALRRRERPPICYTPLTLDLFRQNFRLHEFWTDKPSSHPAPSATVMTLRAAFSRAGTAKQVEGDQEMSGETGNMTI